MTQINENLGQGGRYVDCTMLYHTRTEETLCRADLVCHWEDTDGIIQEVYANVSIHSC